MCETFILIKILVVDTLKDRLSVGVNIWGGGGQIKVHDSRPLSKLLKLRKILTFELKSYLYCEHIFIHFTIFIYTFCI